MNRFIVGLVLSLALVIGFFQTVITAQAATGINRSINYQGRLLNSGGLNVADGNYAIKFSIYTAASGGTPIWTASGTVGSPTAVSVPLTNGLFSVLLGDTTAGQNALDIDWNQDALYLGVTIAGDAEMSPRKKLSAVPYAFNSEALQGNYASSSGISGTSGTGTLFALNQASSTAATATRTALLIETAGTSNFFDYLLRARPTNGADVFSISRNGNVTSTGNFVVGDANSDLMTVNARINSDLTPSSDLAYSLGSGSNRWLTINGGTLNSTSILNSGTVTTSRLSVSNTVGIGVTSATEALDVNGNIENILEVGTDFNTLSTIGTGSGTGPSGIAVQGRYAYVTNFTNNTFEVLDYSHPASPTVISTTSTGLGSAPARIVVRGRYAYVSYYGLGRLAIFDITNPSAAYLVSTVSVGSEPLYLTMQGQYVYVSNRLGASMEVVDVSNPSAPTVVGTYSSFNLPHGIQVSGKYAYVADYNANSLEVMDVSDPRNPRNVASLSFGSGNPHGLALQGRYIYLTRQSASDLKIIDIQNPLSPTVVATIACGGSGCVNPTVSGRYVYIPNNSDDTISVIDVNSSTSPVLVKNFAAAAGQANLFVSGRYLWASNFSADSVSLIDIKGEETNGLIAHAAELGSLQVLGNGTVANQMTVGGGLIVGAGGIFSEGSLSVGATNTTSTFVYAVSSSAAEFSNRLTVGGVAVCLQSGTNCPATAGSISSSTWQFNLVNGTTFLTTTTHDVLLGGNTTATSGFIFDSQSSPGTSTLFLGQSTNTNLLVGTSTYSGGLGSLFSLSGNDILAQGQIGSIGGLFSATGVTVGTSSTVFGDGFIYKNNGAFTMTAVAGALTLQTITSGDIVLDPVSGAAGTSTFGGSTADASVFTSRIGSDLIPAGDSSFRLGSATNRWLGLEATNVTSTYLVTNNLTVNNGITVSTTAPFLLRTVLNNARINQASVYENNVVVSGKYAYVMSTSGGNGRLSVVDISNPSSATTVGSMIQSVTGLARVAVAGKYAYGSANGLVTTIDISNPAQPTTLSSASVSGTIGATDIFVSGKYAYIAATGKLTIVDIASSTAPSWAGTFTSTTGLGTTGGVVVFNNVAYVASVGQITAIDVSSSTGPFLKSIVRDTTQLAGARYLAQSGKRLYVAATNRLTIVDISTPTGTTILGSLVDSTHLAGADQVAVAGNVVYVTARTNHKVVAIDVADPANPYIKGILTDAINLESPAGIAISGLHAYVSFGSAANTSGLSVLSLSGMEMGGLNVGSIAAGSINAESVEIANQLNVRGGITSDGGGILTSGELGVLGTGTSTIVGKIDALSSLNLGGDLLNIPSTFGSSSIYTASSSNQYQFVAARDRYVYATDFGGRFVIFDGSVPTQSPTVLGMAVSSTALASGSVGSFDFVGNYAFVAAGTRLTVIDVSRPTNPIIVYSTTTASMTGITKLKIKGHYAFATQPSSNGAQVLIFDISNPLLPRLVRAIANNARIETSVNSLEINGNDLYTGGGSRFTIIDISDPTTATTTASVSAAVTTNSLAARGQYVWFHNGGGSMRVVDVSSSTNPIVTTCGSVTTGGTAIALAGRYAYIGVGFGVGVVDISSTSTCREITVRPFTPLANVQALAFTGKAIYAATAQGFHVVPVVGIETSGANIGSLNTNTLNINGSITSFGPASFLGGIYGASDIMTQGIFASWSSGTSTFQGAVSSTYGLFDLGLQVGGVSVCLQNGTNCPASGGLSVWTESVTSNTVYLTTTTRDVLMGGSTTATAGFIFDAGSQGTSTLVIGGSTNTNVLIGTSTYGGGLNSRFGLSGNDLLVQGMIGSIEGLFSATGVTVGTGTVVLANSTFYKTDAGDYTFKLNNSASNFQFVNGATSTLTMASSGNVGIGIAVPTEALDVKGSIRNTYSTGQSLKTLFVGALGTAAPRQLTVSGRYAYVISESGNRLYLVDIQDPSLPTIVSSVLLSANPQSVAVDGRYAVTTENSIGRVSVVDISNPSAPVVVGTTTVSFPAQVALQGRYAYVTNNFDGAVEIVDIANPTKPQVISAVDIGTTAGSIYAKGRYVYVTDFSTDRLVILDVADPKNPILASSQVVGDFPTGVWATDRYAYVTNRDSDQLVIVDVSNPSAPFVTATATTDVGPTAVNVMGRYAYVTSYFDATLQIFDVSSSTNPVAVTSVPAAASLGYAGVFISGKHAFITDYDTEELRVIDIGGIETLGVQAESVRTGSLDVLGNSTFANLVEISGGLNVGPGGIFTAGSLAVASTNTTSTILYAVSSTNIEASRQLTVGGVAVCLSNGTNCPSGSGGSISSSTWQYNDVSNIAFLTTSTQDVLIGGGNTTSSALFVVDYRGNTGTATNTILLGGGTTTLVGIGTSTPAEALDVRGNIRNVLAAGDSFVSATSISAGAGVDDVAVFGNYSIVTNQTANTIQIYDITDTANVRSVSTLSVSSGPRGVAVQGNYAYVIGFSQVDVIDISNPAAPVLVSTMTGIGSGKRIAVSGKYAYLGGASVVTVVDISNPSQLVSVGTLTLPGSSNPKDLAVQGSYLYVAGSSPSQTSGTLYILNISNPAVPVVSGSYTVTGSFGPVAEVNVDVQGAYAYFVRGQASSNNLYIIDVSNPTAPVLSSTFALASRARGVKVSGRYAYIADQSSSSCIGACTGYLDIVDVASSTVPQLIQQVPISANDSRPQAVAVAGRSVIVTQSNVDTISVIDVKGIETNGLIAHAAQLGTLRVVNDTIIHGGLSVNSGLSVGTGGVFSAGALAVTATNTTSTIAFAVSSTAGEFSQRLTVGGVAVCLQNGTNCPVSGGSSVWTESAANNTVYLTTTTRDVLMGGNTTATAGFIYDFGENGTSTLVLGGSTNTNVLVGTTTYSGGLSSGYGLSGNDLLVQGMIGSVEGLFSATGVSVGTGTVVLANNAFYKTDAGDFTFKVNNSASNWSFYNGSNQTLSMTSSGNVQVSNTLVTQSGNFLSGVAPGTIANLLSNASFENTVFLNFSNWFGSFPDRPTPTSTSYAGTKGAAYEIDGSGTVEYLEQTIDSTNAQSYTGSVYAQGQAGGETVFLIFYSNAGNIWNFTTDSFDATFNDPVDSDHYFACTLTTSFSRCVADPIVAEDAGVTMRIMGGNNDVAHANEVFVVDGAQLETGNSASTFAAEVTPVTYYNFRNSNASTTINSVDKLFDFTVDGTTTSMFSMDATGLLTQRGSGIQTDNDRSSYAINIPVTDASSHSIDFQIDGTAGISLSAQGDGAGGLSAGTMTVTIGGPGGGTTNINGALMQIGDFGGNLTINSANIGMGQANGTTTITGDMVNGFTFNAGTVNANTLLQNSIAVCLQDGTNCPTSSSFWQYDNALDAVRLNTSTSDVLIGGNILNLPQQGDALEEPGTMNFITGSGPNFVDVEGKYAYVTNVVNDTFAVIDLNNPKQPVQMSTTTLDSGADPVWVQVSGKYAYVVNNGNNTMAVLDVSVPTAPIQVATTTINGACGPTSVALYDHYAYVTNYSCANFLTYDISNPLAPVQVATTTFNETMVANPVRIQGHYAYFLNGTATIHPIQVFDLSNPANPVQIGSATTSASFGTDIYLSGHYAYFTDSFNAELRVFDISNPATPSLVATTNYVTGDLTGISGAGRYVYLTSQSSGKMFTVDVIDPLNPLTVATTTFSSGQTSHLEVVGNYVYVTNPGLNTVDVMDVRGIETNGLTAYSAAIGNLHVRENADISGKLTVNGVSICLTDGTNCPDAVALAVTSSTWQYNSISNTAFLSVPTRDVLMGGGNTTSSALFVVDHQGNTGTATNTILLGGSTTTFVGIGLSNPTAALDIKGNVRNIYHTGQTFSVATTTVAGGSGPTSIAFSGKYAFITNSSNEFRVVDITDPLSPTSVGVITLASNPEMIVTAGRYAYVANSSGDLSVIDVSNPTYPIVRADETLGVNFQGIAIQGKYAYLVDEGLSALTVVDITNPELPASVIQHSVCSNPRDVVTDGIYAYVACNGTGRIQVVNISNPTLPFNVTSTNFVSTNPLKIAISGRYMYVVGDGGGSNNNVDIVDIKDPTSPQIVSSYAVGADPNWISISGRYAFVSHLTDDTVQVLDISSSTAPIGIATTTLALTPLAVEAYGGYLYSLGGGAGSNATVVMPMPVQDVANLRTDMFEVGSMHVLSDASVYDQFSVGGGLSVGVGGISSLGSLSIYSTTTNGPTAIFTNGASNTQPVLQVLGGCNNGTSSTNSYLILAGNLTDNSKFRVGCNGTVAIDGTYNTGGADYAEYFFASSSSFTVGQAVSLATNWVSGSSSQAQITLGDSANRERTLGVVSQYSGFVGNATDATVGNPAYSLVALLGQVPAKVDATTAAIVGGDDLMVSANGVLVKAQGPGRVLGRALESLASGTGTIMVYVQPQWWAGDLLGTDGSGNALLKQDLTIVSSTQASASTTLVDSPYFTFTGKAWNAVSSSVVTTEFNLFADVINASTSLFTIANASGSALLTVSDEGDLTVHGKLYLSNKSSHLGSTSTYLFIDDTAPSSTMISTNADGFQAQSSYDYAERYPSNEALLPGDLVTFDANGPVNTLKRTESSADTVFGIVSTKPGFLTGAYASGTYPIALAGRVPTRVTASNGGIHVGDALTASDIPGVAMKATAPGIIVGYALEGYDLPDEGMIQVFVKTGYFGGTVAADGKISYVEPSQATVEIEGLATIAAGSTDVQVHFASLKALPHIYVTPGASVDGSWWISKKSDTGFTITLEKAQTHDVEFSWLARPMKAGTVRFKSDNTHETIDTLTGQAVPGGATDGGANTNQTVNPQSGNETVTTAGGGENASSSSSGTSTSP